MASEEQEPSQDETVWFREEEQWELTWPIWHMLPHDERKALASKYGYHTIGDFEEYMTLKRAVGRFETEPYDNELVYNREQSTVEPQKESKPKSVPQVDENEEDSDGEEAEDLVESSSDTEN